MIKQSCHNKILNEIYDFNTILKPPAEDAQLSKQQSKMSNEKDMSGDDGDIDAL